ncbi:MAG: hypothetical protein HGA23_04170 [Bacteroidales bacterium]|nr:hypothetical protein [Bacteroidales bacterium]
MRGSLILIILFFWILAGNGQTIDRIEYFFDTDPGLGYATPVSFPTGSSVTANFSIASSGLSEGPHHLLVRAKNVNDKWSSVSDALIYVLGQNAGSQVTKLEYFIGADPGFGMATDIPVTPGNLVPASFQVSTGGLSEGIHYVCIRAKDLSSRWSIISSGMFVYETLSEINISRLEYFIDTDPGFGLGEVIPCTPDNEVNTFFSIPATGLQEGMHYLCVRAQNTSGVWSNLQQGLFYQADEEKHRVAGLEYFIDSDPGFGYGNPVIIDTAHAVTAEFMPDTTTLSVGSHNLMVRVKDEAGNWSTLQNTSFMFGHLLRTWTGAVNDDWSVAGNWMPDGVPGFNDNVLIANGPAVMPVIRTSGLSCNKVFIEEGAGLHINPGIVLTITGK